MTASLQSSVKRQRLGAGSAFVFFAILLLAFASVRAEEIIDPRSGRLSLIETDLVVPAGAIDIALERSLNPAQSTRSLLGPGWRLNWEISLVRTGSRVVIADAPGDTPYAQDRSDANTFIGPAGERLSVATDGRTVRNWPDGSKDTFDANGRLVARDYRNGNVVLLRYDAQGRLSRIDGPKSSFVQFDVDREGRAIGAAGSMGGRVEYSYDAGRLASVRMNGIEAARYAYDGKGALVRLVDPETGSVELAYDGGGRVSSRRWADGSQERYEYDDAGNRVRHSDARGSITTLQWSAESRTLTTTDPLGNKTVVEYDLAGRPAKVTGPDGGSVRTGYDEIGRITAIDNPLGQSVRFEYVDGTSRLRRVTRPDGVAIETDYDARGNLSAVKVNGKPAVSYSYHPDGNLSALKAPSGAEGRFGYHANGLLGSFADESGSAIRFEYDAQGNVTRETDHLGRSTRYEYDAHGRIASYTDPAGQTSRYTYASDGRLATFSEPVSGTVRFKYEDKPSGDSSAAPGPENTYDALGRLVRSVLPNGESETYRYDAAGNLTGVAHSSGAKWAFRYDPSGNLVEVSGPHGYRETFRYDAAGRAIENEDALGRKTAYTYDALGRLTEMRNPAGDVSRREYDAADRLTATVDALGRRILFQYDEQGELVSVESAGAQVLRLTYDRGRLVRATGPAGGSADYSYDSAGFPATQRYANGENFRFRFDAKARTAEAADALGHTWKAAYTPLGELAAVTEPAGGRYSYSYNPLGQLETVVDARGHARRFRYDALGRQAAETDALGRTTEVDFGTAGAIRAVKQPNGQVTEFRYDLLGRPVEATYAGGLTARFRYDAVGNVLEEQMGDYRAVYRYDVLDRVVEATYQPANQMVRYEYDAAGRRTMMEVVGAARWTYDYDEKDRLVRLQDAQGRATRFEYDDAGRVTRQVLPNGVAVSRAYDGRGRMRSVSAQHASRESLVDRRYEYNAAGNVVRESREGGVSLEYAYDVNGRLVSAKGAGAEERVAYDHVGNRVPPGSAAEYDAADQVTRFGSETFGHDAAGRMVSREDGKQRTEYQYDAAGRLAQVRRAGLLVAEYGYDTQGRRVWKKTDSGTRHYVYDGIETLLELDDSRRVVQLWTPGPEEDRPVAFVQQGKTYFPISDVLTSVVAIADEAGAVTGRWDYASFGEWRKGASAQSEQNLPPRGFSGKEFDAETGLYYFLARYYDPKLGRFVTPDPVSGELANPSSLHAYQFAYNNPLRYTDPTGMAAIDIANAIDRRAEGVAEKIGPTVGRVGFSVISGPARVINWFRGEEGRKSNERMNEFVNKASGPVGKGVVTTAASVVSDPLRFGQASGETAARIDQGQKISAWDAAKLGGTELIRGVSVLPVATGVGRVVGAAGRAAAAAPRAATRTVVGAIADYGRSVAGAPGRAYRPGLAGRPAIPARHGPHGGVIEFIGEGGATANGRTFVNSMWGPKWAPQIYAHEGVHALITNIANRFGLTGARDAWYRSPFGKFVEETIAHVVQIKHAELFGGPMGTVTKISGKVLHGARGNPIKVPTTTQGILESVAKNYLGHTDEAAARMAENIMKRTKIAGGIGGTIAVMTPYPIAKAIGWLTGGSEDPAKPPTGTAAGPAKDPSQIDLSDIPVDPTWRPPHGEFDPRRDPSMPGATRDQIARAGKLGDESQSAVPGGGSRPGTGGQPQGGYQSGPEGSGARGPQQPGAAGQGLCPTVDAFGNQVLGACPPGVFPPNWAGPGAGPGGFDPRRERPTWDSLKPPAQRPGSRDPRTPPGSTPPGPIAQGSGGAVSPPNVGVSPGTGTQKPAAGAQCSPPLCREMAEKNCERTNTGFVRDCAQTVGTLPSCFGLAPGQRASEAQYKSLTPERVRNACFNNMLQRCEQGEAGGTGDWCVRKGADASCTDRARRVCG